MSSCQPLFLLRPSPPRSSPMADDPNPFIDETTSEPSQLQQSQSLSSSSSPLNPALIALPESTMYQGADPYPQDQPTLDVTINEPRDTSVQPQELARDRSSSAASSAPTPSPPKDTINVSNSHLHRVLAHIRDFARSSVPQLCLCMDLNRVSNTELHTHSLTHTHRL
jgi:hypothetical protein